MTKFPFKQIEIYKFLSPINNNRVFFCLMTLISFPSEIFYEVYRRCVMPSKFAQVISLLTAGKEVKINGHTMVMKYNQICSKGFTEDGKEVFTPIKAELNTLIQMSENVEI